MISVPFSENIYILSDIPKENTIFGYSVGIVSSSIRGSTHFTSPATDKSIAFCLQYFPIEKVAKINEERPGCNTNAAVTIT